MPEFTELPYYKRPDLSPYLIHLTKRNHKTGTSARDNLMSILREGVIQPSSSRWGFIKGDQEATCLMDVPISALKHVLTTENVASPYPRYEPYGIVISKQYAYKQGARPVLYLSHEEMEALNVPDDQLWRVVHFDVTEEDWAGWLHEREWRCPGPFELPQRHTFTAALVKTASEVPAIRKQLVRHEAEFASVPRSVIPVQVVCEGLPWLDEDALS